MKKSAEKIAAKRYIIQAALEDYNGNKGIICSPKKESIFESIRNKVLFIFAHLFPKIGPHPHFNRIMFLHFELCTIAFYYRKVL